MGNEEKQNGMKPFMAEMNIGKAQEVWGAKKQR